MVMVKSTLALLFAAAAVASPNPLVDRGIVNCAAFRTIVSIMHENAVATPFCSSYLHITTATSTSTVTSTPAAVTTTTTVTGSTDTITTTTFSTVSAVTTVYPVVAVSTTSTCALGATVVQSGSSNVNVKRATTTPCTTSAPPPPPTTIPLGTPICLTGFIQTDVSSACSCLNIPTPTKVSVTTTTLSTSTVTSTVATEAHTTITVTSTTTTWTSTYSGTQYYTSTFTVLPPPSSTQNPPAAPTETFGVYPKLDFSGHDIQNFFCYANGPPAPAPFTGTTCANFDDCVNECAYYNAKALGGNQTCGAVVYNAPADGSSGSCYLKTTVTGCGGPNSMIMTGVILPLVATDPQ